MPNTDLEKARFLAKKVIAATPVKLKNVFLRLSAIESILLLELKPIEKSINSPVSNTFTHKYSKLLKLLSLLLKSFVNEKRIIKANNNEMFKMIISKEANLISLDLESRKDVIPLKEIAM